MTRDEIFQSITAELALAMLIEEVGEVGRGEEA